MYYVADGVAIITAAADVAHPERVHLQEHVRLLAEPRRAFESRRVDGFDFRLDEGGDR